MTQRFTTDGGPELEKRLESWCAAFTVGVRGIIPEWALRAVVLGGGYGRGEGGVVRGPRGEEPYNDLEFYIFVAGPLLAQERRFNKRLLELTHHWTAKTGIEFEIKLLTFEKIRRAQVSMFYHDLVVGHRWLHGVREEFDCEHHRAAHRIPLHEATRLLMNRSSGLLFAAARLDQTAFAGEDADFVRRNIAKAQLALGDAVLTAFGRYHASCRERHRRLEKIEPTPGLAWLPELLRHHAAGVSFKLHPFVSGETRAALRAEHQEMRDLSEQIFLWLEARRLGKGFRSARDYAFDPIEKHPDQRRVRNLLLNLRAFGPRGLATVYPRARLLESLALLLWTPGALSDPDSVAKLQARLGTDSADFAGFVRAYQKIWAQFN